ncbi:MAG: protein kinase domain-containing protein [Persicimonas sp.]
MSESEDKGVDEAKKPSPPRPSAGPPGSKPPPTPAMKKRAPGVRHRDERPAQPTTLRTGQTVAGAFVVERYLGSSGGGVSYLCERKGTDEQVVLKVLAMPYPGDEGFAALRERVKVASSLQHRNLTRILGMGTTADDEMFVAMDYVKGVTVSRAAAERRETGETLGLRDVFTVLAHVCDALEVVHRETVHGVLTPYNIYLSENGVVKVGNLVFARIAGEYLAREENRGPFVDSVYVAPEAPGQLSPASDIYSLGMMAAELLHPAGLPDGRERARQEALDGLRQYPPSLFNLVASCIDSSPANRPATVGDFRATLEDAAREGGAHLGHPVPDGALPIEPAVDVDSELGAEDSDLFNIDLPGGSQTEADGGEEGEERYLVQRDGLDYGPFTRERVLEQLYEDEINEYTPVLDRRTQERMPLGEMEEFAAEVAEYVPKREERKRREAEARAELERKVKKGASVGLMAAVAVGAIVLAVMVYEYLTLPEPEELPMERAFASYDYEFLPPPSEFEEVAVDNDLMESIFNPEASEDEIAQQVEDHAPASASKGEPESGGGGGDDENVSKVDMADGSGSDRHLTDKEINDIIMQRFDELRSCVMEELKTDRSFTGVTVEFFIRPSGTTGGVKIKESKYANRPVGECVKQRFRSMKFPEHGAVSNRGVTFPLRVQ